MMVSLDSQVAKSPSPGRVGLTCLMGIPMGEKDAFVSEDGGTVTLSLDLSSETGKEYDPFREQTVVMANQCVVTGRDGVRWCGKPGEDMSFFVGLLGMVKAGRGYCCVTFSEMSDRSLRLCEVHVYP